MLVVPFDDLLGVNEGEVHVQDLTAQESEETIDVLSLFLRSIALFHLFKVVVGEDHFEQLEVKRV